MTNASSEEFLPLCFSRNYPSRNAGTIWPSVSNSTQTRRLTERKGNRFRPRNRTGEGNLLGAKLRNEADLQRGAFQISCHSELMNCRVSGLESTPHQHASIAKHSMRSDFRETCPLKGVPYYNFCSCFGLGIAPKKLCSSVPVTNMELYDMRIVGGPMGPLRRGMDHVM